jgi:hypothetical protein
MAELEFNYKGYALFSDVEDRDLRIRNQATVLANIYEDNPELSDKSSVSKRGALLIFGYMENVFPEDRKDVTIQFHETMKTRGYASAA